MINNINPALLFSQQSQCLLTMDVAEVGRRRLTVFVIGRCWKAAKFVPQAGALYYFDVPSAIDKTNARSSCLFSNSLFRTVRIKAYMQSSFS